jgi:antitoxin (DNA-binding transcriptional repressor) of toxin-antitoxin stability system
MHEAKTHLSALVDDAVKGEPFIIAKSGKPQVVVYAYVAANERPRRTGFMPDLVIPEDFNTMMADEIAEMFYGGEI